ncbi:hypothetical protein RFM26_31785 [Mesorhizobium sp. VK23B]|uniref:Uncharacterized protein n=1 Tax=Mesorhizobium dulcispinae TaxID=3072316 RepID=A0ABU4XPL8_9HYPH|nr:MULTISPECIES: hypothetical protein [unclassified Mesorhizobium]MDX8470262.1 hypothetical protein [Mesorhizobium sp. VK23B]MDX8476683.1 hypothetical protein [Mesorhizobium sp. VK23A]
MAAVEIDPSSQGTGDYRQKLNFTYSGSLPSAEKASRMPALWPVGSGYEAEKPAGIRRRLLFAAVRAALRANCGAQASRDASAALDSLEGHGHLCGQIEVARPLKKRAIGMTL